MKSKSNKVKIKHKVHTHKWNMRMDIMSLWASSNRIMIRQRPWLTGHKSQQRTLVDLQELTSKGFVISIWGIQEVNM